MSIISARVDPDRFFGLTIPFISPFLFAGGMLYLFRNPLIIACVAALFLKNLDLQLPGVLLEFLTILGRASLPLGLMAVGAALSFQRSRAEAMTLSMVSLNRLILMPLLMLLACHIFEITGMARSIAILFAALPGSPAAGAGHGGRIIEVKIIKGMIRTRNQQLSFASTGRATRSQHGEDKRFHPFPFYFPIPA